MHKNLILPVSKAGYWTDMQNFYDACLPGNSFVLNDYDSVTMRLVDNEFNLQPCRLTLSKADPVTESMKMEKKDFLIPLVKTAAERPRIPGLLENLVAIVKRNFNTPDLAGSLDISSISKSVVDNFFSTFLRDEQLADHLCKVRSLSLESFSAWFDNQSTCALGQLSNFDFIDLPPVDVYNHMIKRQPKSKLDTSIQSEYPALQTIVYHSKLVNAVFGPVFRYLTSEFLSMVDNSRFFFYTRKTPEDLQDFFSTLSSKQEYEILELDVSKYDKSQNDFHQAVEMLIWERLGLDDILARIWEMGHKKTHVSDFQAGIKTLIYYQRKSGDVTTFIGNTFIIAACVASMVPLSRSFKAAFCGDDSLIYMPPNLEYTDIQSTANLVWNFEAKLYRKKYGYFCGKYVIHHANGCIVYPDPLKLISKLGNKSLESYDHLEEFRISLMDVAKPLFNAAYFHLLDDAIHEYFPTVGGSTFAISTLCKYLSEKQLFRSLFIKRSV